jgi:tetratricopeptide (TPR) repeat protein
MTIIIYLKEKNYEAALPIFNDALKVAKQINASKIIADVYKSLTAYYYSSNNSEKAFNYQKLSDVIRDSLYKAETDLKIANLKNRFELNQKLKELELIDIELKSEKVISSDRLLIIYVVGITGIVLLISLIYRHYRI